MKYLENVKLILKRIVQSILTSCLWRWFLILCGILFFHCSFSINTCTFKVLFQCTNILLFWWCDPEAMAKVVFLPSAKPVSFGAQRSSPTLGGYTGTCLHWHTQEICIVHTRHFIECLCLHRKTQLIRFVYTGSNCCPVWPWTPRRWSSCVSLPSSGPMGPHHHT
jgi:hypothetical protein